MMLLDIQS